MVHSGKFILISSIASTIVWKIWIKSWKTPVNHTSVIVKIHLIRRRSRFCTFWLALEDLVGNGCRWVCGGNLNIRQWKLINWLFQLRARSPQPHHSHSGSPANSHHFQQPPQNQNSRKAEPYYCDRTLLQSLVRDAMVTETFGQENVRSTGKKEDKQ